jgi:hypothetical protein
LRAVLALIRISKGDVGIAPVPIRHRAQAKEHPGCDAEERQARTLEVETVLLLEYDGKRLEGQVQDTENQRIPASLSASH